MVLGTVASCGVVASGPCKYIHSWVRAIQELTLSFANGLQHHGVHVKLSIQEWLRNSIGCCRSLWLLLFLWSQHLSEPD